jgi:hypothetical protein
VRSAGVGAVDFPTLGHLIDAWIEQHCRVPQGFARGQSFKTADWQFWCIANHYRVRDDARWIPERPLLNQAFVYRRSQIVAPQKTGKGPLGASITAAEAAGPVIFGGHARRGDRYRCDDNGCDCGWTYEYLAGEPKGIRHPSPLIQLTATSEDQVDTNLFGHLRTSIRLGPLKDLLLTREGFVRIVGSGDEDDPEADRIDVVTASANSRVGNPISFAVQDETGLYTASNKMRAVAEGQRRGAAGMGGRTLEMTNAWDPSENSVAQTTYETNAADVFVFYRNPDDVPELRDKSGNRLDYTRKDHRQRLHEFAYEGSWWVDLNSIEGEAAELVTKDPAQAARFFGNRLEYGAGAWDAEGLWRLAYAGA